MSDYNDDYEDQDGPADLRAALKKANARLKEIEKALEAEKAEKATLSAQVKKSSLADLLKQAGVDPKFAARADKDGADATETGVKAWIEENKDFYNFGPAKAAEVVEEPQGQPTVPEGMEAAIRASQSLDASGVAPSDVDIASKIQSIATANRQSEAELLAELSGLGVKVTDGY